MIDELFVKVCGITRPQDAELASGLGAKALGFIFWSKSPRYIAPRDAFTIAEMLPPHVLKVGVFVDEPAERVAALMTELRLDVAKLHGREDGAY